MSNAAELAWRMLRYRVAAMIWMFLLLGAAVEGPLRWTISYAWIGIALAASYIAATTINDVADEDVDTINHPGDRGRPLVVGDASRKQLIALHVAMVVTALAFGGLAGWIPLALVAAGLLIGIVYSAPPIRLSYRTYAAPLVLTVAYVLIPFLLGVAIGGSRVGSRYLAFGVALGLFFLARINLKDFRDRAGDARYGKPTLLLRFGKNVTCAVSLVCLVAADVTLIAGLAPPPGVIAVVQVLCLAIAGLLHMLWREASHEREQIAIGLGARLGNGLLLTILAWMVMDRAGAPATDATVFAAFLGAVYLVSTLALAARPDQVQIAYKA